MCARRPDSVELARCLGVRARQDRHRDWPLRQEQQTTIFFAQKVEPSDFLWPTFAIGRL